MRYGRIGTSRLQGGKNAPGRDAAGHFPEKQVARKDRLDAEGALSNARMYDPDALPIREMLYARAVQNEKNLSAAEKRPYFTRIDFTETGKQSQTYYIGQIRAC